MKIKEKVLASILTLIMIFSGLTPVFAQVSTDIIFDISTVKVENFKANEDAIVSFEAENISATEVTAKFIIGLYNLDNNKMETYNFAWLTVEEKDKITYGALIPIPSEGNYKIKTFVWNKMDTPTTISNIVELASNKDDNSSSETTDSANYDWSMFRLDEHNNALVNLKTPKNSSEASLKWEKQLSFQWEGISSILNTDEYIYVAAGDVLYKLDSEGNEITKTTLSGSTGYYTNFLAIGDGKIFAHIGQGRVQAVDMETMQSLWISTYGEEEYSSITPITYDKEKKCIYVGGGTSKSDKGTFAAINVDVDPDPKSTIEENKPEWTYDNDRGFYWSGATLVDDFLIFGSDGGSLISVAADTGVQVDIKENLTQDINGIRTSVVYDEETEKVFVGTKGGEFWGITLKDNGKFDDENSKSYNLGAACTSVATIYNGRVYVGAGETTGTITVLNANDMTKIYKAEVGDGSVQGSIVLSQGYATEDNDHEVYIYFTRNNNPGGLYVLKDSEKTMSAPSYSDLYVPIENKNYCISSPIISEDGTIYYSNDSGYIFAVEKIEAEVEPVKIGSAYIMVDDIAARPDVENLIEPTPKGVILSETLVDIYEGDKASDFIARAFEKNNIDAVGVKAGFITEIDSIAMKDGGDDSYWTFTVNGYAPQLKPNWGAGINDYVMQPNDFLHLSYTCIDWGADIGLGFAPVEDNVITKFIIEANGEKINFKEEFNKSKLDYFVTLPQNAKNLKIRYLQNLAGVTTITSENIEYKMWQDIPVELNSIIKVSMGEKQEEYIITTTKASISVNVIN